MHQTIEKIAKSQLQGLGAEVIYEETFEEEDEEIQIEDLEEPLTKWRTSSLKYMNL